MANFTSDHRPKHLSPGPTYLQEGQQSMFVLLQNCNPNFAILHFHGSTALILITLAHKVIRRLLQA